MIDFTRSRNGSAVADEWATHLNFNNSMTMEQIVEIVARVFLDAWVSMHDNSDQFVIDNSNDEDIFDDEDTDDYDSDEFI